MKRGLGVLGVILLLKKNWEKWIFINNRSLLDSQFWKLRCKAATSNKGLGVSCINSMVEGQASMYDTERASAIHYFYHVPSSIADINPFINSELSWFCCLLKVLLTILDIEMKFKHEVWRAHSKQHGERFLFIYLFNLVFLGHSIKVFMLLN